MAASLETLTEELSKLIKKFESDRYHYLSKNYSEAQARIDFITPLFKALGWDVENQAGLPHHEREVIVEKGETEGRFSSKPRRPPSRSTLLDTFFKPRVTPGTPSKFFFVALDSTSLVW